MTIITLGENKRGNESFGGFKRKILSDWTDPPDLQVSKLTEFVHLFLQYKLVVKNVRAALENGMSLWLTHSEEGRISVLSSFNWSLFCTTQTFTSEMQDSKVRAKVNASEGKSDLYSSVSSTNMWREREWWLITSERGWVYNIKRIGFRTESWGAPQIRSEGNDLTSFTVIVFYLPGKSKGRTEQDHKYRKCFGGESEGCHDIVLKAAIRSGGVRMMIKVDWKMCQRLFW